MSYVYPTIEDFKTYFSRDFPYGTDPATSVTDADISKAYGQSMMGFASDLWEPQTSFTIAYLLLAAHYLVIDLRMAGGVGGGAYSWIQTSKAVGSVSESFQVPQRILDNPELAMLSQTQYGAKYLQLMLPNLTGQIFNVYGSTRP